MRKSYYKVIADDGPAKGASFPLTGPVHRLGRGEEADICILDTAISKVHCLIEMTDGKVFIVDTGSRNGTFLDGIRLLPERRYELEAGGVIRIGNSVLRFVAEPAAVDEAEMMRESTEEIHPVAPPAVPAAAPVAREESWPFYVSSSRLVATLNRILGRIGIVQRRSDLLERACRALVSSLPVDRAALFLAETPGEEGLLPAARASRDPADPFPDASINREVIDRVLGEGNTLVTVQSWAGQAGGGTLRSILCSPLRTPQRMLGVIYLETISGSEAFRMEDAQTLASVGLVLGSAAENLDASADRGDVLLAVTKTLINIVEARDPFTVGHAASVERISAAIGRHLGLDRAEEEALSLCALLHDIGKAAVPAELLTKPGPLDEEELTVMRKHPVAGASFVNHLTGFGAIIDGILSHHERFDGKGYPNGLAGRDIPLFARIIAVADTFDAMTSDRAWRKSFGPKEVVDELLGNRGGRFDGDVVEAFIAAMKAGDIAYRKERTISLSPFRP
jgi:putative nucleotidyltransferase with HDIG domain